MGKELAGFWRASGWTRWICLAVVSIVLASCSGSDSSQGKAKVKIPWPTGSGEYSLQKVSLLHLKDPTRLSSSWVRVYYDVFIDNHGFEGEVAQPSLSRVGSTYIPRNVESLMALTMFAHMERLVALDFKIGATGLPLPREVGLGLKVDDGKGGLEANDAWYYDKLDIIAVPPYTRNNLPISANAGIIAHEHFHAHFNHRVLKPLRGVISAEFDKIPEDQDLTVSQYNAYVLRAWNEGLADYWGYAYSGDAEFMTDSFGGGRDLNKPLSPGHTIWSAKKLEQYLNDSKFKPKVGLSYSVGNHLARTLYQITNVKQPLQVDSGLASPQKSLLKHIVQQLPRLRRHLEAKWHLERLSPDALLWVLFSDMPLTQDVCGILLGVVESPLVLESFTAECWETNPRKDIEHAQ